MNRYILQQQWIAELIISLVLNFYQLFFKENNLRIFQIFDQLVKRLLTNYIITVLCSRKSEDA